LGGNGIRDLVCSHRAARRKQGEVVASRNASKRHRATVICGRSYQRKRCKACAPSQTNKTKKKKNPRLTLTAPITLSPCFSFPKPACEPRCLRLPHAPRSLLSSFRQKFAPSPSSPIARGLRTQDSKAFIHFFKKRLRFLSPARFLLTLFPQRGQLPFAPNRRRRSLHS